MKKTLLLVVPVLLLQGCIFTTTPTEFASGTGLAMDTNQNEITACLQWVKDKEAADRALIDKLSGNGKAMAVMHHDTMDMIKNVWGKESNACKPGTNGWDAYIAYVKETEQSKRQYSSDLKSVATFGIVTTGAVKLADSVMGAAGDRINNSGDQSNIQKTEDNDKTTALANDKSDATANSAGSGDDKQKGSSGACTISATQLSDCRTTQTGTATADEYNACLTRDYGYSAEEIAACPQ